MSVEILGVLLRTGFASSIAILLVFFLRVPLRHMFGADTAYSVWLMVPTVGVASCLPARSVAIPLIEQIELWQFTDAVVDYGMAVSSGRLGAPSSAELWWSRISTEEAATLLMALWLAGVAGSLLVLFLRQRRVLLRLGSKAGLRRRRVVRADSREIGPAVVGVLRPFIVLPSDFETRYSEIERSLILEHERSHIAARDAQINALAALARCLNWYNPLFYFACEWLRVDQELACDARVMRRRFSARRFYAEAMLKTQFAHQGIILGCRWPSRNQDFLRRRIAMLAAPARSMVRRISGAAFCFGVTVLAGVLVWAFQPSRAASMEANSFPSNRSGDVQQENRDRGFLGKELITAVKSGDLAKVQELIAAGADVDFCGVGDGTALILSTRYSNLAIVNLLLDTGADVDHAEPGSGTPLIVAASQGHLPLMGILIRRGAKINMISREEGSPLAQAIINNQQTATRYLISEGADVNLTLSFQRRFVGEKTPLSLAAELGYAEISEQLLDAGAKS